LPHFARQLRGAFLIAIQPSHKATADKRAIGKGDNMDLINENVLKDMIRTIVQEELGKTTPSSHAPVENKPAPANSVPASASVIDTFKPHIPQSPPTPVSAPLQTPVVGGPAMTPAPTVSAAPAVASPTATPAPAAALDMPIG